VTKLQKTFWVALLIKLAIATVLPLTNDEAYYWVWSQHLQLSYYDHPPFVAWLFWLGQQINLYASMVRWPGVLLGHATLALWLLILKPYFDEEQRFYWLVLALLSPLVGGTNLIVTPDLPLLFCNALSLYVFYRWRAQQVWWLALLFGVAMGLGLSAKYVMVLFPLCLFPLVLLSKQIRGPFLRQSGWILLGVAVGALPVWLWNAGNDFASLRFQASHGLGRSVWKPSWTIEYAAAQIGLVFPPVLYWAIKAKRKLPAVFHLMAWVPLLFFLVTTSRGYAEANWPIVAHPAVFALAAASIPRNVRALQWTAMLWWLLIASLAAVIILQPAWSRTTKFREFHQFDQVIEAARALEPLYARSYQMAAKMHFQLGRPVYKLKGMNRKDFYDYLDESEPSAPVYYVAVEAGDSLPLYYTSRAHKITARIAVGDQFEIWKVEELP
jgi:4-amino-4-deoxy-L-arabinose transferase-like glycosyltransferase